MTHSFDLPPQVAPRPDAAADRGRRVQLLERFADLLRPERLADSRAEQALRGIEPGPAGQAA